MVYYLPHVAISVFFLQVSTVEEGVKLHTNGRVDCGASTAVRGDILKFVSRTGDTGIVKFLEPMSRPLNYFEYLITDRGEKSFIGIGVGGREYPLNRMPGWNATSVGYHADDGHLYHEASQGDVFGPTCTTGDRMGCGVDFDGDCGDGYVHVFFTKNGRQVGNVVRMKLPPGGFYPLVGMHSRREKVRYLGHWKRLPGGKSGPDSRSETEAAADVSAPSYTLLFLLLPCMD